MRLWIALIGLGAPLVATAGVIDRVVVTVEEQLVMESDIRLEEALSKLDTSPSPFWDATRVPVNQRLVQAAVFRELAGDVGLYQPDDVSVAQRLGSIRDKFESDEEWSDFLAYWGLDAPGLATVIRRRMVVERFLARNLQADPTNRTAWWAACDALLEQVGPRYRVRVIDQRGLP